MTIKHKKTSTAGAATDTSLVGGPDWNADHTVDAGGIAMLASDTAPATPAAGGMTLYAQNVAGQPLPAFVMPDGRALPLQPLIGRGTPTVVWIATTGSTTPTAWGCGPATGGGTATARLPNWNTSILFQALPRHGVVSAATAGSLARWQSNGNVASRPYITSPTVFSYGGFRLIARWGCSDAATVSGARTFVGLSLTSFSGNPSNATNFVGVGTDSGDSTLSVFVNDSFGTATKLPLGANFPDHTLSTDIYELVMVCLRDGASISVDVTRINTGDTSHTSLTTDLAPTASGLAFYAQRGNGATALAVSLDLFSLYIEQEF